jgi:hypothetical protein
MNLRVINSENGISLGRCPNRLRRKFYDYYSLNNELLSADAFLCTYAFASCVELFMPFNRSIIVIFTTRFETGRHDAKSWRSWIQQLRRVAASPYNVVAANNMYDLEYVKYFTGLQNVQLLPSHCGYVKAKYSPSRPQILIGPGHDERLIPEALVEGLYEAARNTNLQFSRIGDLYERYEFSDLAAHPAVVLVPYQTSIMTVFELYRMQIPMFAPSPELLVSWHVQHNLLYQRTWSGVHRNPVTRSVLPRHPNSTSLVADWDPNNDFSKEAILSWLQFSDFYQWPHIATFDSWEQLVVLLQRSDLARVSSSMGVFNRKQEAETRGKWEDIMAKVLNGRLTRKKLRQRLPAELNEALLPSYGIRLSNSNCNKVRFMNRTQRIGVGLDGS